MAYLDSNICLITGKGFRSYGFALFTIILLFVGCSTMSKLPGFEKRKLLSVYHLLEIEKFEDAKELIESMIEDETALEWPRLWYARGLLCQNAYIKGKNSNNVKLMTLYPDQLYIALESYEKALELDRAGRLDRMIAPGYIYLANELQKLGGQNYRSGDYKKALRNFSKAIEITESPLITIPTDSNLLYNAALAAYKAEVWDMASKYLYILHKAGYSVNVSHLLAYVNIINNDTLAAIDVLEEAVDIFSGSEELVLLLSDLKLNTNDTKGAINVLRNAIRHDSTNYKYYYTEGMIFQRTGDFDNALKAYKKADSLESKNPEILFLIATCYYNLGVEIEEHALRISSRSVLQIEREKSLVAFNEARSWLRKAFDSNPTDQMLLQRMKELRRALRLVNEETVNIEK